MFKHGGSRLLRPIKIKISQHVKMLFFQTVENFLTVEMLASELLKLYRGVCQVFAITPTNN
jgi:hypothetical protein